MGLTYDFKYWYNGNQFENINIAGQKRHDDQEDFFEGEKYTEEEEDIIYLEDMDDLILRVKTKIPKKMNSRFYWLYLCIFIGPIKVHTLYLYFQHLKDFMAVHDEAINISCNFCTKKFVTFGLGLNHMQACHSLNIRQITVYFWKNLGTTWLIIAELK